ncbi:nuclear protein localization protein 4 [Meyerozyma guilliermondii]
MIIRFRTPSGMLRVNATPETAFNDLLNDLGNQMGESDLSSFTFSDKPNDKGSSANTFHGKSVADLGLKHGDMLYVTRTATSSSPAVTASVNEPKSGSAVVTKPINTAGIIPIHGPTKVKQLEVDDVLDTQDGMIKRKKSNLCRHGEKGMCEYCSPLPSWDKGYREENGIKHMSFHAYVNQINEQKNNRNNSTSYMSPLEEPDYNVNLNCPSGHAPYPKGICSKCQPPVITLQQQQFRMVDHVEFADSGILNDFIDVWRQTGVQRFGFMFGRYEVFDKVPLGIKAVVEAIYEPPQAGETDGITLLPWENQELVLKVAEKLNLYPVGIAFTDLTDSGARNGTVLCKRHKDTYFLSCLEVLMAARFQIEHPNITKHSNSGRFSSKFVTCVVSGGLEGEIEPRSFQVSTNAEALVRADIITGSTQPSMLYINSSQGKRYVPDVFYSKINEYGLEVKTNAKPAFPVDFLLVTLSDAFPLNPTPRFTNGFTIENRDFMGNLQDLRAAYRYINSDPGNGSCLSNFHFIVYLVTLGILGDSELQMVFDFVNERKEEDYLKLVESSGWMTLITILEQST